MKNSKFNPLWLLGIVVIALAIIIPKVMSNNKEEATTEYVVENETTEKITTETPTESITEESTTIAPTEATTEESTTVAPTEEPTEAKKEYKFRNSKLLNQHYEKHGIEMGFASAKEYEKAASAVVNNKNALHKIEKEDGDDVYYVEKTNEFVIVAKDGFLRTYFNPSAGINYYNRQ